MSLLRVGSVINSIKNVKGNSDTKCRLAFMLLVLKLELFHGIWCVPGSPYRSMDGALRANRFARENGRPFLGTCGGFQHAIIESLRNVAGLKHADHAESNPDAKMPVIVRLACSLAG